MEELYIRKEMKNSLIGHVGQGCFVIYLLLMCHGVIAQADRVDAGEIKKMARQAETALEKGIGYYRSIAINGGYVYHYTVEMDKRWGEGPTDDQTVEVQSPGTPAVGMAILNAYQVTGNPAFLEAAKAAANALILGQNRLGGWEHTISFDRPKARRVSFDDDQTQGAIRYLRALDRVIDDPALTSAIDRALDMMLKSQLESGAWPHMFPEQGNYHDYATFNDGGINDCIRVMINAARLYEDPVYKESISKAGRFILLAQLPPPQPGWAQQYNQYLQPAWARSFEPPSVCTQVTMRNIHTLIDLYVFTGNRQYLEPIPDAIRWLEEIRLDNGLWARFVELSTNKALYYDRGRIRVDDPQQLTLERRTGYGYQVDLDLGLQDAKARWQQLTALPHREYLAEMQARDRLSKEELQAELVKQWPAVNSIIEDQDKKGRWITRDDRYKKRNPGQLWNGEYEVRDRISSAVFIENVNQLSVFLKLYHNAY
jgi:hypothetical protein